MQASRSGWNHRRRLRVSVLAHRGSIRYPRRRMGGARILRCSECPRLLADAATTRRRRGLPQRSPDSATCSDKCEGRREARFRRQARERGYRLEPGDWRCEECGCVAKEAVAQRARDGRKLSAAGIMVTCSVECHAAWVNRRTAALKREAQWQREVNARLKALRQARSRQWVPPSWRCTECGIGPDQAGRERQLRGERGLPVNAVTCGAPGCRRERERARLREKYGPGTPYYALQREHDQARRGRAPVDGGRLHPEGSRDAQRGGGRLEGSSGSRAS
jgi:hypothetical protein